MRRWKRPLPPRRYRPVPRAYQRISLFARQCKSYAKMTKKDMVYAIYWCYEEGGIYEEFGQKRHFMPLPVRVCTVRQSHFLGLKDVNSTWGNWADNKQGSWVPIKCYGFYVLRSPEERARIARTWHRHHDKKKKKRR